MCPSFAQSVLLLLCVFAHINEQLSLSTYVCMIEGRAQWKRSKRLKSQKNHFNCSLLLSYIWPKEPDVTQRHFNNYMSFFWFSKQLSQCKCPDTIEPETPWRTWKLGIYIFSLGIFGGGKNKNSAMGKDILKRYQNSVTISAFLTLWDTYSPFHFYPIPLPFFMASWLS